MESTPQKGTFFNFLKTWGGEWMWTNISNEGPGFSWVIKAMTNGTAVWVTDGSYMKEIALTISGAGWILLCTQSGFRLCISFAEFTSSAGSCIGELQDFWLSTRCEQLLRPTNLSQQQRELSVAIIKDPSSSQSRRDRASQRAHHRRI